MTTREPRLEIEYCTQCRWLLRAAWTAQELLTTFSAELGEVALIPGTGGVFDIRIADETVWSRKEQDGFGGPRHPEAAGARPDRSRSRTRPHRPSRTGLVS